MSWVITQGELQQEAGAGEMCTYAHCHMDIFVGDLCKKEKKKSGESKLELLVDYNVRSALHTFSYSKMINMFSGSPSNTQNSEAQQDSEIPSS